MTTSQDKPKYGYKAVPQLSASQMAEYVSSGTTPPRRRTIIRNARFPKTSIVAQYGGAAEGLVNFLNDSNRNFKHLAEAAERLKRREERRDASDWIRRDSRFSIEALDAFQRNYNRLGLPKLDCRRVTGRLPLLADWPTKISVALDVTIHRFRNSERDRIGGAIFLFSRGESSSKSRVERCKTIGGLIYVFCEKHLQLQGDADPDLCFAFDVFTGTKHTPPGTFARKLGHISEACEEIADRWKRIGPPDDYDGPPYD